MGGLLYFVPLVVMMALVFVALWLIGRWFGRIETGSNRAGASL
jgi:hypothetical protein